MADRIVISRVPKATKMMASMTVKRWDRSLGLPTAEDEEVDISAIVEDLFSHIDPRKCQKLG
jgi:hypothetical protein